MAEVTSNIVEDVEKTFLTFTSFQMDHENEGNRVQNASE